MTSKEWEKRTLEEDRKIKKRIRKYRDRSSGRVILGLIIAVFGLDTLNDVIKKINASVGEYTKTVDNNRMSLDVIAGGFKAAAAGIDGRLVLISLAVLLLSLAVFIWAVRAKSKADALDEELLVWMPDEAEIADIKGRFDNDFVRRVLSEVSAGETETVKVALEGIVIESNEGEVSFNFNKEGFRRLTNYESKQLAFYIGSMAFPDGFIIHQLKKHATVYSNYTRGYTETGDIRKKAPEEAEVIKENVRWLLKEISKLTGNKKLRPKDELVKAIDVEGGHIVINKGYSENSDKYKAL
jgi:hypothetical protein